MCDDSTTPFFTTSARGLIEAIMCLFSEEPAPQQWTLADAIKLLYSNPSSDGGNA